MNSRPSQTRRLRDRILSGLHLGHLQPGDRLPSIRQVAAESGEDARAISRAYRQLEAEGLVEIRTRSGIYVAPQAHLGGDVLEESAQWVALVVDMEPRDTIARTWGTGGVRRRRAP